MTRRACPKRPTERPLDDGVRYGPEVWRRVGDVAFCHWDRWLLRLALAEPRGLASIAETFRARNAGQRGDEFEEHEAMLAQVADLARRLHATAQSPETLLDQEERASEWLLAKARKRVWLSGPNHPTEAMSRTPRRLLEARALSGSWAVFPVSPAPFFARFGQRFGPGCCYDYRLSGVVTEVFELDVDEALLLVRDDAEQLAVLRAALSVAIIAMEHVDDSLADMAEVFANYCRAYFVLVPGFADTPGVLRDLLELWVWEDYGLFQDLAPFLLGLPEPARNTARAQLAAVIVELRAVELSRQLEKATDLARRLLDITAVNDDIRNH